MEILELHPENPQKRFMPKIAEVLDNGGLVVYPTDSGYSVGSNAHDNKAIQKLYALKKPLKKYVMALLFGSFDDVSEYAKISNTAYRFMKSRIPGPYTFILPAQTHIVRKLGVKRKEIGIRFPENTFLQALFENFSKPILNTAAKIEEKQELTTLDELVEVFGHSVDLICYTEDVVIQPTNIIDLCSGAPEVIRGEL